MLDDLFTITCGHCKSTAPVAKWAHRDDLSRFQCPRCHFAFQRRAKLDRKPWDPFIELVEITPGAPHLRAPR